MQHCWNKDNADCTLVIPVPDSAFKGAQVPCISLRLHRDCLSAKSLFLRGLLNGVAPVDLIQSLCASRLPPKSAPLRIPRSRLPRLLPSPPSHPTVLLPVPDPSSIQMLIEWMYLGDTKAIEDALDSSDVEWQGLARNVEYLALSTDIKVFLGRWYRRWMLPLQCSSDDSPYASDEEDDDDDDMSDWDDNFPARGRTAHVKVL